MIKALIKQVKQVAESLFYVTLLSTLVWMFVWVFACKWY